MKEKYIGKWRIEEMELWDRDFIDLVVRGHITVKKDGMGLLRFGAVEAEIDWRVELVAGVERLEFSFEGVDEGDPVSGRGWAQVEGPSMNGRIYFHLGDDSAFSAKRQGNQQLLD
jgi:hypothetical protein